MPHKPPRLDPLQRRALLRIVADPAAPEGERRRARVVLLLARGVPGVKTARRTRYSPVQVSRILRRFREEGVAGLRERPRAGRPPAVSARAAAAAVVLALTGSARVRRTRTTRRVARKLGISHGTVRRIWRAHGIPSRLRRSFMMAADPHGERTAMDVVGLRIAPPRSVLVLSVTLSPPAPRQRKSRPPRVRRILPDMIAALRTATGEVPARSSARARDEDLLAFLKRLRARHHRGELHVIAESVRPAVKGALRRWLTWRRLVRLHPVPPGAPWRAIVRAWLFAMSDRSGAPRAQLLRLAAAIDARLARAPEGRFVWPAASSSRGSHRRQ